MKRKAILIPLVILLVIGCIAGSVAYAVTSHNPPKGQKLISIVHCGVNAPPDQYTSEPFRVVYCDTGFEIANPNCNRTLNITYFAILDGNGTVVLEGTPQQLNQTAWEETLVPEQLGPHQIWQFALVYFLGGAPIFQGDSPPAYTVEVSWSGSADRPLVGSWEPVYHVWYFDGYDPNLGFDEQVKSQMDGGGAVEQMLSFIR